MHVRKGDEVVVLSGNDRGKRGEIKQAFPKRGRVLVEGVNLRWQHRKPTQNNPKGERVQAEVPIHASNVRAVDAPSQKSKKAKTERKAQKGSGAKQ